MIWINKELLFWDYLRKYCLTNCATLPDSNNKAIKLGITINPLHVSEIPQINPRSAVAPMIAIKE